MERQYLSFAPKSQQFLLVNGHSIQCLCHEIIKIDWITLANTYVEQYSKTHDYAVALIMYTLLFEDFPPLSFYFCNCLKRGEK